MRTKTSATLFAGFWFTCRVASSRRLRHGVTTSHDGLASFFECVPCYLLRRYSSKFAASVSEGKARGPRTFDAALGLAPVGLRVDLDCHAIVGDVCFARFMGVLCTEGRPQAKRAPSSTFAGFPAGSARQRTATRSTPLIAVLSKVLFVLANPFPSTRYRLRFAVHSAHSIRAASTTGAAVADCWRTRRRLHAGTKPHDIRHAGPDFPMKGVPLESRPTPSGRSLKIRRRSRRVRW